MHNCLIGDTGKQVEVNMVNDASLIMFTMFVFFEHCEKFISEVFYKEMPFKLHPKGRTAYGPQLGEVGTEDKTISLSLGV